MNPNTEHVREAFVALRDHRKRKFRKKDALRKWERGKRRQDKWIELAPIARGRVGDQECGSTERLQVHHLTYVRLKHERPEDVRTLCRVCHQKTHRKVFA